MFPWCVFDFSLLDAIESGLVKIPRVPVEDDSNADSPIWRRLFQNTNPKTLHRDGLRDADQIGTRRALPQLRGGLRAVVRRERRAADAPPGSALLCVGDGAWMSQMRGSVTCAASRNAHMANLVPQFPK